jgi:hypothetical protein
MSKSLKYQRIWQWVVSLTTGTVGRYGTTGASVVWCSDSLRLCQYRRHGGSDYQAHSCPPGHCSDRAGPCRLPIRFAHGGWTVLRAAPDPQIDAADRSTASDRSRWLGRPGCGVGQLNCPQSPAVGALFSLADRHIGMPSSRVSRPEEPDLRHPKRL